MRHNHNEAFLRMRYEGPNGLREWVWNSRDGITPFCLSSADGVADMHHGNWHLDQYLPAYVPPVGSRVFVDMTEEIARPKAVSYVERHWENPEYPMKDHPVFAELGRERSIEYFVKEWIADWGGHAPICVEVTEAMHAQFKARAEMIAKGMQPT